VASMVALMTTQTNHYFQSLDGKKLSDEENTCACQENQNE